MGDHTNPARPLGPWCGLHSRREFVARAVEILQAPPHRMEHVTPAQVVALLGRVGVSKRLSPEDWCDNAVRTWVDDARRFGGSQKGGGA